MNRRLIAMVLIVAISLFVSSCTQWYTRPEGRYVDPDYRRGQDKPGLMSPDGQLLAPQKEVFRFELGPKDEVQLTVRNHPEFSGQSLRIDREGLLRIPNTDIYAVMRKKTIPEAEQEIAFALRKYLKRDPFVQIEIENANSRTYYVIGEGGATGKISMGDEDVTLRDALIEAGVHRSEDADLRQVFVIRPHKTNPTIVEVDGKAVLLGKDRDNYILQDKDIVFVPTRWIKQLEDVVDFLLQTSGDYVSADNNFQTLEDLLPSREKGR